MAGSADSNSFSDIKEKIPDEQNLPIVVARADVGGLRKPIERSMDANRQWIDGPECYVNCLD